MNKNIGQWKMLPVVLAVGVFLLSGCKEQGPVELVDREEPGQIEIISPPPQPVPGMELGDADSSGIIPVPPGRYMAHLMVAGARYDAPGFVKEASASRGIFFDRNAPVLLPNGALAYRTVDIGTLGLDDSLMWKTQKRLRHGHLDTTLGVQYLLFSMRTTGFRYTGGREYRWEGTGSGPVGPFSIQIPSPPNLLVQHPTYATPVPVSGDLRVRWTGGGARVRLVISRTGDTRLDSRPILHLKLGKNRGGAIIPARVLRLLPRDQDRFVFTFFSDVVETGRIDGYPDDVLVQALTSHSVLVEVSR